jgi:cyclohexanecarboxyl-CoA dehydrogenase
LVKESTQTQQLFRNSIRSLVKKEIKPRVRDLGEQNEIVRDLWEKICAIGVLESNAVGECGGRSDDATLLGIAAEEIARGDVSLAATLVPNASFCVLMQSGNKHLQDQWLPPVIRGGKLSCIAVTEPECGTDVAAMETTAVRDAEDYLLNGKKAAVGWGMQADVAAVFAKTDPLKGIKGISCFLLPLHLPGIVKTPIPDMGQKASTRANWVLENVRVPKHFLVGREGEGFALFKEELHLNRILVALISIGAAESVLDQTIAYAKKRIAFGRPIAKFEGVSFKVVECATLLSAAKALCYRALWLKDRGSKYTKESAMCKWWATQVAVDVIHEALLLHGHYGYSVDAGIEQRLRDVIGNQLADGSPEGMKLTLVRELFGKDFLPF